MVGSRRPFETRASLLGSLHNDRKRETCKGFPFFYINTQSSPVAEPRIRRFFRRKILQLALLTPSEGLFIKRALLGRKAGFCLWQNFLPKTERQFSLENWR